MLRKQKQIKAVHEPFWYKDAIIYELHVRSFFDSNGDGIGDFPGVTQKLDYLADLGVTALWLLPFYPSPLKDDGYDIADYYSINPMYGNLADFKVFLREAHRRGMRVITELVLNHTSDQNAWFQRARHAKTGSPERDFYVWTNDPQKYKEVRIIFKDFEPSNWSWDPVAHAYYWHRFFSHQPDLNFDNPKVHDEIFKVLDFWCDMGVDGFRLDAIPYLYEREGTSGESLPETHEFLKKLRRHVDEKYGDRVFLAEANQWPEESVVYFGQGKGDECHMAFHFPLMPRLFMSLRMEDRVPIVDILEQTPPLPESSQWALFLRNHDELTLEMVTDEERDYMYRVYANDSKARINLGIRRRLGPLLGNDRKKIELLNLLLFSLPGTPVVYYGDEIGMGDNIYLGDRNGVRTPMHWSSDKNACFSRATPQALPLPIIIDPEHHYESINVEAQQRNPNSLLWWMKRLITLRKRWKAFGRGTLEFLRPKNRKVLAFIRRFENETVLVVANLSRYAQPAKLDLSEFKNHIPVEMFGRTEFPSIASHPYFLTLNPHSAYWFSLKPVATPVPESVESVLPELPTIAVRNEWEDVLRGPRKKELEAILPNWIRTRPWFFGKERDIQATRLEELASMGVNGSRALITLLTVDYVHDDPERYVLPLAWTSERQGTQLLRDWRELAITELRVGDTTGILYDAVGNKLFGKALAESILRRRSYKGTDSEVSGLTEGASRRAAGEGLPEPKLSRTDQRNTTLRFGDKVFLKMFRRLESGTNPEVEVSRLLARKGFAHNPPLLGTIELRSAELQHVTLAMMSGIIPQARSAWEFTLDTLSRYLDRVRTIPEEAAQEFANKPAPVLALAESHVPPNVSDLVGTYLESARLLGQRAGELHVALASETISPDFSAEPFTPFYLRSIYQSMRNQIVENFELLSRARNTMSPETKAAAGRLLQSKETVLKRLRSIFEKQVTGLRIRCHGNFHLAEVLYTGKDFVIIDFEGDPSRSITERKIKRSAMHDITRMIRSFDYAAHVALAHQVERGDIKAADTAAFRPWLRFWHHWVSGEFLKAYLAVTAQTALLPGTRDQLATLLYANLFDKSIYELGNELRARQSRAAIPIEAALDTLEMWNRDEQRSSTPPKTRQTLRH